MPSDDSEKLERRAKNILLHRLSRSMRTRHELQQVLKKREIPDDIAFQVLNRFEEAQLIDDRVYAEAFVRARLQLGKSVSMIRRELRQKGIVDSLIAESTSEISSEQEQQLANELALSRMRRMSSIERDVAERRLLGFLQRRGFSQQLAFQAVRNALGPR